MARILLCTFGSLGDLHPYLAVGRGLAGRGHAVTVATFRAYGPRVEAAGLGFHAVRPHLDPTDPRELQRALHRRTGPEYVIRDVALAHLRDSFDDCREAARGADLVVTHPIGFGALLAARLSRRPWASVALAPVSLFSTTDPCVYTGLPFGEAIASLPSAFQRALQRLVDRGTSRWLGPYRALERELGLPRGPNPVIAGQHSPHLVLALFSRQLAAPQADWPARTRITGFPFHAQGDGLGAELAAFLDAGEPPVVFTLGSAAVGTAGDFFEESLSAARALGMRGLLLTGSDPDNVPHSAVGDDVLAAPYAPHSAVFPRAAVVVHQGGVGTTGEALRAGRPMLVVPYSHDQPDHAHRLCRLGVARSIPRERYTARAAAAAIGRLRRDHAAARRASEIAAHVRVEDGVRQACDALEELLTHAGERPAQGR